MELDVFENPWYGARGRHRSAAKKGGRKRRGLRNPIAMPATMREWTQGVDLMDGIAAVGGLAAATMIPGLIVKDTSTTGKKLLKLVVAIGCALGAGALGRSMVSSAVGRAAILGGVAGVGAQALGAFTSVQIGQPKLLGRGRIGETTLISPSLTREGERVGIIQP